MTQQNPTDPHDDILKNTIFQEYRTYFVILLILSGAAISAEVFASILFGNWVNLLKVEEPTWGVLAYGFLIPLMYASSWILNAVFFKLDIDARFFVYQFAFTRLVSKSIYGTIDLLTRAKPGRISQDIRNASESVANMYNMLAFYGFRFVVILIASVILLGSIAWWAPLLIFAISIISMIVSYRQHAVCIERSKQYVADQGITTGNLVEIFERLRIVKTFKQESRILTSVEGDIAHEGVSKRSLRSSFLQLSLIQIAYKSIVIFTFLAIGIFSFAAGTIELGSLAMLITFSMTLSSVIEDLATRLYELISHFTKYKQVLENIEKDKTMSMGRTVFSVGTGAEKAEIKISNLSVQAGPEVILEGVDLNLSADKKVALMGPSGCGKTSLAETILGLRHYQGSIEFVSAKQNDVFKIVEVEQNPIHIGESLLEWLTFGNPIASADLIEQAVHTAALDDIMQAGKTAELRPGLTLNGLSRGQRQRAAIARALIAEPDYIIFDEPTSALNSETATTIMNAILGLGIGVLIITHDLAYQFMFDVVHKYENKTFV